MGSRRDDATRCMTGSALASSAIQYTTAARLPGVSSAKNTVHAAGDRRVDASAADREPGAAYQGLSPSSRLIAECSADQKHHATKQVTVHSCM